MPRTTQPWKPKKPGKSGKSPKIPPVEGWKYSLGYVFVAIISISLFNWLIEANDSSIVPYSTFKSMVSSGQILSIDMDTNYYTGYAEATKQDGRPGMTGQRTTYKTVPVYDPDFTRLLDEKGITYSAVSRESNAMIGFILNWVLPIGLMFFLWRMLQKRMTGMGSNVLAVGQNKAVIVAEGDIKTKFSDVAGVDEAKEELVEVVEDRKSVV